MVPILLLLATGGYLLRGSRVRDLLNDETSCVNRLASQALGFCVTTITALALYVGSIFGPVSFNEGVHILVTLGVGSALISFAARERRGHGLG